MAVITVTRGDSFQQWINKSNDLNTALGDPDATNPRLASVVTTAVNDLVDDIGDLSNVEASLQQDYNQDGDYDLVDGMNNMKNQIDRKRLTKGHIMAYDCHPQDLLGINDFDFIGDGA
jgi:hypothetical protein